MTYRDRIVARTREFGFAGVAAVLFAAFGVGSMLLTRAAVSTVSIEAEHGSIIGCASSVTDGQASGGRAIQFGKNDNCEESPGPVKE